MHKHSYPSNNITRIVRVYKHWRIRRGVRRFFYAPTDRCCRGGKLPKHVASAAAAAYFFLRPYLRTYSSNGLIVAVGYVRLD